MPSDSTVNAVTLRLCTGCEGGGMREGKSAVQDALDKAGLADLVRVRPAACLGACEAPRSLALQSPGRASYVFAGVDLIEQATDIAATCQTYLDAPKGWIEDARPCGTLRHQLRARIPDLDS